MSMKTIEGMSGEKTVKTTINIHRMDDEEFRTLGEDYPAGEYDCNKGRNCIWFELTWFGMVITIWPVTHGAFTALMDDIDKESEEE